MYRLLSKIFICFYVFLLCINQNSIIINAFNKSSNEFKVGLEIDESVGNLTGLFDDIGSFDSNGIMIITRKVNILQLSTKVNIQNNTLSVVVPPNEDIKELMCNFVSTLRDENSDFNEFIVQYNSIKTKDKDFIKYLSKNDRYSLENKIFEYFGKNIIIEYIGDIYAQSIKGIVLNLNLDKVINNELISITIEINNAYDETIFNNYLEMNNYDTYYTYIFDISILDGNGNQLTTFITPVEFTLSLPKYMRGLGELSILQYHNNQFVEVSTTYGLDNTFSFETNKFPKFALVRKEKLVSDDSLSSEMNELYWINYLLIVVCMLVLFGISFYFLKKKIESI